MENLSKHIILVMAIFWSGVAAALLFFILLKQIPKENVQNAGIVLGTVSSIVGAIIGYFFGSSKSSQAKDETIANMSKATVFVAAIGLMLFASCNSEKKVLKNNEAFNRIGEAYVVQHPCYTVPEIHVKHDTTTTIHTDTTTALVYIDTSKTFIKEKIITKWKDRTIHDSITISKPDLRKENVLTKENQDLKSDKDKLSEEKSYWKDHCIGTWVILVLILIILLILKLKPRIL